MNKAALVFGLMALGIWLLTFFLGLRVNWYSDSTPKGLYRKVADSVERGDYAVTCLNRQTAEFGLERGYLLQGSCETGIQPVVKPVAAMEGDSVLIKGDTITINGHVLSQYKIQHSDSQGRPLEHLSSGEYHLKQGEYFLLSSYRPNSWDSRYWGMARIQYVVKPVVTFERYKVLR